MRLLSRHFETVQRITEDALEECPECLRDCSSYARGGSEARRSEQEFCLKTKQFQELVNAGGGKFDEVV